MRYLTSDTNIAATGSATATNVLPSSAFELVERDADGGGDVRLTGSYTGAQDADFDIEILSDTINSAPTISAPVYAGVGNGTLTGLSATAGVPAQRVTVTVTDLGTLTLQAWAPFQSVNLRAITPGPDGNDLSLQIDQSTLVVTDTDYAVTQLLEAGAEEFDGEAFNFGATLQEPGGTVPADAPRLRFGDDVTVYRHWRSFRQGRYRYHFSPAIERDVPVGTRVRLVTGGRTVRVYDGVTLEETYTGVSTLYSLLTQIQASSTLIEVDGIVASDRLPGGMACDDLTLFTESYLAGSVRDGTLYVRRAEIDIEVASAAPTETLSIDCISAAIVGAEIWSVRGSVSGDLGNAISGQEFAAGSYSLTIPQQFQPGGIPPGDKSAALILRPRSTTEIAPVLCVSNFLLGSEAQQRTYNFIWTSRPAGECDCRGERVSGGPVDDFLGIDTSIGGTVLASLPAPLKSRVETIDAWRKQQLSSNAGFVSAVGDALVPITAGSAQAGDFAMIVQGVARTISAKLVYDEADVDAVYLAARMAEDALYDIYEQKGNDFPSAAATAFDAEFSAIMGWFVNLIGYNASGSDSWGRLVQSAYQETYGTISFDDPLAGAQVNAASKVAEADAGSGNLTNDMKVVRQICQAHLIPVYTAADLRHPFDVATRRGNAVWQDHGGSAWFASEDGLLPIQPGHYYHSARMVMDDDGVEEPEATREFGIGVAIGCVENLKDGDRLVIKTGPYANARATYQQGDSITVEIIRADPVAFQGGQTGNNLITLGVRGSVHGPYADYVLDRTTVTPYSNGGLAFTVNPGAIPFAAGDQWTFAIEGGEARWRKDGGSWTTVDIAATVALSDGVSARFDGGVWPSFLAGDSYTIRALAINGVGSALRPDDRSLAWDTSTQIDLSPVGSGLADVLMLAHHTIPSDATITLTGSNDAFATTALTATIPWRRDTITYLLPTSTTCTAWRISINRSGSIGWLYLGSGRSLYLQTGKRELGTLRQTPALRTALRPRTVAGRIEHTACTQSSVDALMASLETALTDDAGRMGYVTAAGEGDLVRLSGDRLEIEDAFAFQPAADRRLLSLTIPVTTL